MDIIAVRNQDILRLQVKSTMKKNDVWSYQWQTSKSNPKRTLTIEDCDVVACVALDMRKIIFFPIEIISKQITRRTAESKMLSPTIEEDSWKTALELALKS